MHGGKMNASSLCRTHGSWRSHQSTCVGDKCMMRLKRTAFTCIFSLQNWQFLTPKSDRQEWIEIDRHCLKGNFVEYVPDMNFINHLVPLPHCFMNSAFWCFRVYLIGKKMWRNKNWVRWKVEEIKIKNKIFLFFIIGWRENWEK